MAYPKSEVKNKQPSADPVVVAPKVEAPKPVEVPKKPTDTKKPTHKK